MALYSRGAHFRRTRNERDNVKNEEKYSCAQCILMIFYTVVIVYIVITLSEWADPRNEDVTIPEVVKSHFEYLKNLLKRVI